MTSNEPVQPLFDTHQHLLYRGRFRYSWTDSIGELATGEFELSDYRDSAASAEISKTLFMEAGVDDEFWQDETRFLLALANKPSNKIAGIVAGCRPESDADSFDAWLEELASTAVVGFRRILHVEPDELSRSTQFVRNIRQLGRHGKTFDMCFLERQLPSAVSLAQACDNTQLILDHCGVPDVASGQLNAWKEGILQLAALPNVNCKLSGVIAYCSANQPLRETIQPYIEHCIEAFGWDRLVWGSDWPVCNMTADLSAWASIFRELLAAESADVRNAVFMSNAERIYGVHD